MDMPTLETLDNLVIGEYNRDEMEPLEFVIAENADFEICLNHSSFDDVTHWKQINMPMSICEETMVSLSYHLYRKQHSVPKYVVQKYSIMNPVEYKIRKSNPTLRVLEYR
ncbi:hypothetical protein QQ045_011013 [Rhodiola kirilowii]